MRQSIFSIGLLLLPLLGAIGGEGPAPAASTYHISTTGSDANAGTLSAPFRTIQKGVNVATPGSTILVHAGTYTQVVVIDHSGNSSARIMLASAGDGAVILRPSLPSEPCSQSTPTRNRAIQIIGGSDYWTIRGLTIDGGVLVSGDPLSAITDARVRDRTLPGRGTYDPTAAAGLLGRIGVDGADHVELLNNKITGRGIFAVAARYGLIEGNEVHHVDRGTGAGIWINSFSDFWTVRDNYVHDIPESDAHPMSEGIRQGRGSSYNLIEDNLVEDLGGYGRGITVDVYASWNVMRANTVRRADQGLNEQSAGWGNQWLGNLTGIEPALWSEHRRQGRLSDGAGRRRAGQDEGSLYPSAQQRARGPAHRRGSAVRLRYERFPNRVVEPAPHRLLGP